MKCTAHGDSGKTCVSRWSAWGILAGLATVAMGILMVAGVFAAMDREAARQCALSTVGQQATVSSAATATRLTANIGR